MSEKAVTVRQLAGMSNQGFDDAIRQALTHAVAFGKAQWFEVLEQKGRLIYGSKYQYLVTLKVGIETASGNEECPACHQPAGEGGHKCMMIVKEDKVCEWCGQTTSDPWHLCKAMMPHISYVCKGCGRIAVRETNLCFPCLISG